MAAPSKYRHPTLPRRRLLVATTLAFGIVLVSASTTASVAGDVATKAPGLALAAASAGAGRAAPKQGDSPAAVGAPPPCVSQPNTEPSDPNMLKIGVDLSQQLCDTDQILWSSVYLQAGLTYTISTRHVSGDGDTELSLYSPDAKLLLVRDNDGGAEPGASRLVVTASTSATYLIAVTRNAAARPTGTLVYDLRAD
jgi:hypothetical protein